MTEFFPADAALILLIGMGPFKAVLVYMGATAGMEADVKRRVALKMVSVAGIVAVGLFVLGRPFRSSCTSLMPPSPSPAG